MAIVCPTVTTFDLREYRRQLDIASKLSGRIHIDLMDGIFAPTKSPALSEIWLPHVSVVDIHLMYQKPMDYLDQLVRLKPHMVIIQAEVDVHHMHFVAELHKADIKAGLSILQETPVENIYKIMHSFDHVLVFSGNLGHQGGVFDVKNLAKVAQIRSEYHDVEIGWDGGIDDQNAQKLLQAGVEVLNVGGYIQKSDNPERSYQKIVDQL